MLSSILNSVKKTQSFDFSSVTITYKTNTGTWRGFVMPYDLTYEADTKETVIQILKDMTNSYIEGLEKNNNPSHLNNVPLSDKKDKVMWSEISNEVTNKLLNKVRSFQGDNYYAKAQLPS